MNNDDLLRLYEELLAVKAGLELDLIAIDKIKPCLDEFYRNLEGGQTIGLLAILVKRQYLSTSQVSFLREGVLEDTCVFAPEIDISDRIAVEELLGISLQHEPQSQSCSVACPHCNAQYHMETNDFSNKLRCARCHSYFYLSIAPGSSPVVSRYPISHGGPFQPLRTVSLSAAEMDKIGKDIFERRKPQEPDQPLWNFEPELSPTGKKMASEEKLKSLWSSGTDTEIPKNEAGDEFSTALWSSDQFDAIDGSEIINGKNSLKAPLGEMQNNEENAAMPPDLLKLPKEDIVDSFDLLNISCSPAPQTESMGTIELDIRATPLFKGKSENEKKPGAKTTKAYLQIVSSLSHEESLVILKYAVSYNFISNAESKALLNVYYRSLAKGEKSGNFVTLLISDGYITKFQYDTLQRALKKDRSAGRIPSLNTASRNQVDKFLGSGEEKKLIRISCPYCQTSFRVRIGSKGGKFRCGKCHKSFFSR